MTRVLVAHASKYGSVEEVARYVGAALRDEGATCDVVAARAAEELDRYDLVVLGTGIYMGRLHREARRFLRRHHDDLGQAPFAVFALGPLSDDRAEKEKCGRSSSTGLERYPQLEPVATAIFGGVIDPEKMAFPFQPHARGRPP